MKEDRAEVEARATFGEVHMKLFKRAARVRVMKTRVEVHLAATTGSCCYGSFMNLRSIRP